MISRAFGPSGDIDCFLRGASSDAVIFDSGKSPRAVWRQKRSQILDLQIVTNIPVEISVSGIPWVTFLSAPDLLTGEPIPSKCSWARSGEARRVNRVPRPRIAEHQSVGIEREPS